MNPPPQPSVCWTERVPTPDPLDGLKFAFACAHNSDPQNPLRDTLSLLLQRFVHMDTEVNDLRYSDGSPVFVITEVEPGLNMRSHFPPPGYNDAPRAS